jgi:hypothetical protein
VTCSQYGCVTAQVRNFAVKLLLGSDQSFRGEYLQYNLGKPVLGICEGARQSNAQSLK